MSSLGKMRIRKDTYHITDESFVDLYCYEDANGSTRTMNEGDDYFSVEDGVIIESTWDDVSPDVFSDTIPYYKSLEKAIESHGMLGVYLSDGRLITAEEALTLY